ncbi:putative sterigmatocystin biosynthesis monooxygenase stcW [Cryoendolithus antarcticus]|uniref:Putative sterigmatocystin biosynthesis monooxygenase stcW n=1 Tax=Cryoendolithus antarcticus TaxID=1507870 RepID=A0A1V8TP79_9PEZI|nr:putative sterigmatocystin biosynthesis monooxygenase stcW [Cryoendolithus antarcticus]
MAPDLNAVAAGGQFDYSQFGSGGYEIRQDVTWGDPKNRKLKVLTIGGGVSGILMAYQIQKLTENVEHVIYEKNEDIAGTWLENRYPGCACDIPSHAYTYNFALNPDWPRFFSYSPDIFKYLEKVVSTFDLRKYMTFNTEVTGCFWNEEKGQWLVKLRQTKPGQEPREFEDTCDLLLHGTGILNNFKWPDIPGLKDKFKGKVVHTARWPKDYQKEQWANDRVAVIGSGASSIQTVPNMQPHTKHLDIFVRTGVWFVQIANNFGMNKEYDQKERDEFRHNPKALVAHAKDIEDQVNGLWGAFYDGSEAQAGAQKLFGERMAEFIKDERLLKGFTPKFGVGCRRITPGDPYMNAIQNDNVDVHFTPVESCTEKGVVGGDGVEREVDTIVCATGFDVSYKPRFPIVGANSVDLADKWKICPEAYLGVCVPDIPNFITFIGPSWPVENGSVMGPLHTVSEYAIQWIKKMQNENVKSFAPTQEKTDAFNDHVQEWIKHTVWKDSCRSWYKNNATGRVNAVYPGSSMHYQKLIEIPRYEDFNITSHSKNPFEFLGMGWTLENRAGPEGADCSPYLSLENVDPKWYEAVGGNAEDLRRLRQEERGKELEGRGRWLERRF